MTLKTEVISYTLTDENGEEYPVTCTVVYKRSMNARPNSECAEAEPQARHYGTERD